MSTNAVSGTRGMERNAGRKRASIRGNIRGDGDMTTPIGVQQPPREERSAKHLAGQGNELIKQPGAKQKSYS